MKKIKKMISREIFRASLDLDLVSCRLTDAIDDLNELPNSADLKQSVLIAQALIKATVEELEKTQGRLENE